MERYSIEYIPEKGVQVRYAVVERLDGEANYRLQYLPSPHYTRYASLRAAVDAVYDELMADLEAGVVSTIEINRLD